MFIHVLRINIYIESCMLVQLIRCKYLYNLHSSSKKYQIHKIVNISPNQKNSFQNHCLFGQQYILSYLHYFLIITGIGNGIKALRKLFLFTFLEHF